MLMIFTLSQVRHADVLWYFFSLLWTSKWRFRSSKHFLDTCTRLLLLHNKFPQFKHKCIISQFLCCKTQVNTDYHSVEIKVSDGAKISSEAQEAPFPSSLVVGRIQFLMTVGLRSSDPKGCPPFPATWLSPQDGSLFLHGQQESICCCLE